MADAEKRVQKQLAVGEKRVRYLGPLSDAQIALAAHQCYANARSLLDDARRLATRSPARALSLTVLALEEFAKIPLLFERRPDEPPERWAEFWKEEFSRHSIKQKQSGAYGQLFSAAGRDTYAWEFSAELIGMLDRLKQQGFYVEMNGARAQSPDEFGAEMREPLDVLFAAAEERVDSFAQFHHSAERSAWYLSELRKPVRGSWPPPVPSGPDVTAVVLGLASRFSRGQPPDYTAFAVACAQLCFPVPLATQRSAFDSLMETLHERVEVDAVGLAAARAYQMLKLANSYRQRLGADAHGPQ